MRNFRGFPSKIRNCKLYFGKNERSQFRFNYTKFPIVIVCSFRLLQTQKPRSSKRHLSFYSYDIMARNAARYYIQIFSVRSRGVIHTCVINHRSIAEKCASLDGFVLNELLHYSQLLTKLELEADSESFSKTYALLYTMNFRRHIRPQCRYCALASKEKSL